jgi:processive 1,2-diacylglycerol beta-glucosyltransferase
MKVDIFVSDAGSNKSVGLTIADTLQTKYPDAKINLIAVDKIWPGGEFGSFDFYKSCAQNGRHRIIEMMTGMGTGLFSLNEKAAVRALEKRLEEDRPDLAICATALIGSSLLKAANKTMTPSMIVCSDVDPRFSLFRWENSSTPHRIGLPFSCHEITSKLPTTINPDNVQFIGYPIRKEFKRQYSPEEISEFHRELCLPQDKEIISITMGSLGGNITRDYVSHLIHAHKTKKITTPVHYVIMCGNNKGLIPKIQSLLKGFKETSPMTFVSQDGSLSFSLLGFTKEIHKYLACSSAVITKPGPAAICEAIELGLPLIPSKIGGMLQWEEIGIDIVDQYSLGKPISNWKKLAETVNSVLDPKTNASFRKQLAEFKEQRKEQFDFSGNIINLTETLVKEGQEAKANLPTSKARLPFHKKLVNGMKETAKQIVQAIMTFFKSLGNLFLWPFKKMADMWFFSGFRTNNHAEKFQRRKKLLDEQGAVPIEGLFSTVSKKAIDALYIKSKAPNRTGNLLIYSVAKSYENARPKNFVPFLESGADVLLFNPSANTTKTMEADLKQLILKLKEKNPDQKIAIYGHCLAGHVASSVGSDFNDGSVSLIIDRGYGDGYALADKVTLIASFVKPYIKNNYSAYSLDRIGNFKGRALFISPKHGGDQLLHTKTKNMTRELFNLWSKNKPEEQTKNAYVELPKGADHWSPLDLQTQTRINEFLKEQNIIASLPKLDPKVFHPAHPTYFSRKILPFLLKNPYSMQK